MAAAEFAVERSKALLLIDEAAARLQESISFGRGDPAPHWYVLFSNIQSNTSK